MQRYRRTDRTIEDLFILDYDVESLDLVNLTTFAAYLG